MEAFWQFFSRTNASIVDRRWVGRMGVGWEVAVADEKKAKEFGVVMVSEITHNSPAF